MSTVTLYHKPARYANGKRRLDYQAVVGLGVVDGGKSKAPLVFDGDDLTRFIFPGPIGYEHTSMPMLPGAAGRLHALMAHCFTSPRHACTNRDLAAAVMGCAPDKLTGGRVVQPHTTIGGDAYALVNTRRSAIIYFAISVAPDHILTYSRFFGISLLNTAEVLEQWGTDHAIMTVRRKG
jgi:hypothetical protein